MHTDAKVNIALTHSEKSCISQLNTTDILEFEAQIEERLPETLAWLPTDECYVSWLSGSACALLLVTGYAGCGKTVLSSYLRRRLPLDYQPASVIWRFYCDAKAQDLRSDVILMRSVIYQAVVCSRQLLRIVVKAARHDKWLWDSFERLWTLFEKISAAYDGDGLVIIIDAIDELEEDTQRRLSSHILQFMRSGAAGSTRFLITSQPHASAVGELQLHSLRLALESNPDLLINDVCVFIRHSVQKLRFQKHWSQSLCSQLILMLESNADQSFLWVSFAVLMLAKQDILNVESLASVLSRIPPDLARCYDRMLGTFLHREPPTAAVLLLNVILSSTRPLSVAEIALLLALSPSHESVTEARQSRAIESAQSIQSILGPLIKVHDDKVRLVHTSLRDHLDRAGAEFGISEVLGHEILAERCVRYLLLKEFDLDSLDTDHSVRALSSQLSSSPVDSNPVPDDQDATELNEAFHILFEEPDEYNSEDSRPGYELRDYAIRFWAIHFQRSGSKPGAPLFLLVLNLYKVMRYWNDYVRTGLSTSEYPRDPDALCLS